MNEYAIFCKLELMLVVDAQDEQQARQLAAQTKVSNWEYFLSEKRISIELLGPSEETDDEATDVERRYREKDLNENSGDYAEESHGS